MADTDRLEPLELGRVLSALEHKEQYIHPEHRLKYRELLDTLSKHVVAVTADDGFASVLATNTRILEQALPLLKADDHRDRIEKAKQDAREAWATWSRQVTKPSVTLLVTSAATGIVSLLAGSSFGPTVSAWLKQLLPSIF